MLRFTAQLLNNWHPKDTTDMAAFNIAATTMTVETGPRITTLFKANATNNWSMWKHK